MRIALDATPLTVPTGGVRRYVEELTRALAAGWPEDRLYLVTDQPFQTSLDRLPNVERGQAPQNSLDRKWWAIGIQRELSRIEADVFHGTDFAAPYLPARPSVLTLHDLSPWREDTAEHTSKRVRSRTPVLLRLGAATLILTPTEAIRREALERFRLDEARVVVTPLAASSLFRPVSTQSGRPYFLHLGTLEYRKNLEVIIDAWREIRKRHEVDLVLAGRARPGFEIPTEPGLQLPGPVSDEQLPALYSGALACLNPSRYEGFGLPALEAMQCGAMVIASCDPATAEVTGDGAMRVSDDGGWVEAMTLAMDPMIRRAWSERGTRRAAQFSWKRTAQLTREAYDEARRRF